MIDVASFQGRHRGETIVVCGCGESLNALEHPERFVTIGVNDVGRRFDPTYLVVVNPRSQFAADRYRHVEQTRAQYVFSQLDLPFARDRGVRFRLGRYGGTTFGDPRVLHYTRNSPYVAMCLAAHMGARRIALVGVDFTDHHFFGGAPGHPLNRHLETIDAEYRRLGEALTALGVDVVSLSEVSRLTAFPKVSEASLDAVSPEPPRRPERRRRVFGVTYRFLACGDVFTEGLRHAAASIGVEWADADWSDAGLPQRVAAFAPDLLFVVHGRRFAQRWRDTFRSYRQAVWLLDEPYEVDDTAGFSGRFDHVFVNDPATIGRHRSAVYLPVCYDPAIHHDSGGDRPHDVGFIGGGNPTRERALAGLASQGLLTCVAGGPWHDPSLKRLCRAANLAPAAVADLYRSTKIVVNVFRDRHHYNRSGVAATSMNPRIYEALACGALVVSEFRPEIGEVVPELPVFRDAAELPAILRRYLLDPAELDATRAACLRRLRSATYAERLRTVLSTIAAPTAEARPATVAVETAAPTGETTPAPPATAHDDWQEAGPMGCREAGGEIELTAIQAERPGSERGLVTSLAHRDVTLSLDLRLDAGACAVIKINQQAQFDQASNSYHLYLDAGRAHLARHHCVFKRLDVPTEAWIELRLGYRGGRLSLGIGGRQVHEIQDSSLAAGYAVISVKRGVVRVRSIRLSSASTTAGATASAGIAAAARPAADEALFAIVPPDPALEPRISIVTTVYDRVDALGRCLRSVRAQQFQDYEQIVVSDGPPDNVVRQIAALVRSFGDRRLSYLSLPRRHNNWGIAPAAVGLRVARGRYLCFLSDDNGYTPEHLGLLSTVLDEDVDLGFAYSSCRYAGRLTLRHPVPAPARIDLGQPMFRRSLFPTHLGNDLPFQVMAWDWAMIDAFVRRGVRWRHVDVPSFIFRLARYPGLMAHA